MPVWKIVEFDFSFIHSTAYWTDDTQTKLASSQFCQNLFMSFRDGAYSPMNGIWPDPHMQNYAQQKDVCAQEKQQCEWKSMSSCTHNIHSYYIYRMQPLRTRQN